MYRTTMVLNWRGKALVDHNNAQGYLGGYERSAVVQFPVFSSAL
jgi:hypothetical protein